LSKRSTHGAFGLLQFIPSVFKDLPLMGMDGKIDLFNFEDAMASSANYLHQNGWGMEKANRRRHYIHITVIRVTSVP
jgi:membrane-bound lytic murein transglycosylase B